MKFRLLSLAILAAFLSVFVVAPMDAGAQPATGGTAEFQNLGVEGTVSNLRATLDRATGNITVSGTFTSVANGADNFTSTLLQANGTCEILTLVLGPLHLDLLGLEIDLNQVVLEITAVAGPGNLLGNLLCAIAGLLDSNAIGDALVRLLNQLFRLLG